MVNGTRINAHDRQSLVASVQKDDWMAEGACRDLHPSLFYPVGTTGPAVGQIRQAKQVCAECTVREPCLDYAVATNQEGIWGGTDEGERVLIGAERRRRAAEVRA